MTPTGAPERLAMTGFVMAGGKSRRLGQDKVLLPWHGVSLLEHAVRRLKACCETVRVCGGLEGAKRRELSSPAVQELEWVPDCMADAGPLAGIVPALDGMRTAWGLFLAVDTPRVPVDWLRRIAEGALVAEGRGVQAVVTESEGRAEPLCAAYHRSLAPGLRRALERGAYKLADAVEGAGRLERFPVEVFEAGARSWFLNINTAEDWQCSQALG